MRKIFSNSRVLSVVVYMAVFSILFLAVGVTAYNINRLQQTRNNLTVKFLADNKIDQQEQVILDNVRRTETNIIVKNALLTVFALAILISFHELTRRALRKNVELQKRFVDDVSHELKHPLAILRTNLEVDLKANGTARTRKNLEEANKIATIIDNLLLISRAEVDIPLSETVSLHQITRRVVAALTPSAQSKGVVIRGPEGEGAVVQGNAVALEEITRNLLENAVRYTPAGGSVTVSLEKDGPKTIALWVSDTGIGIDERHLPHIFEPFYRGDALIPSSGLGLTIVRALVKQHKGSIAVESEPNVGTTIRITLPALDR